MRYALILAGGSGTRLWPLSRAGTPKQLAPLFADRSLLELAYRRLDGLVPENRRFVCGSERHRAACVTVIPELGRPSDSGLNRYLGEPEGRDTLAALILSAAVVALEDPDAVMAVFTSDHVMRPETDLRARVDRAYRLVEDRPDTLITFGVVPDRPSIGFGYLELGKELSGGARRVLRFLEKPDAASAAAFVAAGSARYLWNSGMFVWRVSRFLELAGRYEPELTSLTIGAATRARSPGFGSDLAAVYPSLKKISVDYGVMTPASADPSVEIVALPMSLEWRDIGSWTAYGGLLAEDGEGNATFGETCLVESRDDIVASFEEGHLVACLGCEELVVVHTADATLVCPRGRTDELKKLYEKAAAMQGGRYR